MKLFSTISDILIIFGVVLLLQQYVFSVGQVSGQSMEPTLVEGQKIIVDRVSYKMTNPKRFDIVAVKFPKKDAYWVKRIIGLPGERIDYLNNQLFVNGNKVAEPFLAPDAFTENFSTMDLFPLNNAQIPNGQYLVLGDNRQHSDDGRMEGTLGKKDMLGVARLSIYPLDRIGILRIERNITKEMYI